jgi:hypothetical protein
LHDEIQGLVARLRNAESAAATFGDQIQALDKLVRAGVGKVKVLNNTTQANSPRERGNTANASMELVFDTKAVVFISGWGTSGYKPTPPRQGGSGIVLKLSRGADTIAMADSFEGLSNEITYRASASSAFILNARTPTRVSATVYPYGSESSLNEYTQAHISVIAIEAN